MEKETQKVVRYVLTDRVSDAEGVKEGESIYHFINRDDIQSKLGLEPGNINSSVYYINARGEISRLRNRKDKTGFCGAEFPMTRYKGEGYLLCGDRVINVDVLPHNITINSEEAIAYFKRSMEVHEELSDPPIAIVYKKQKKQFRKAVNSLGMKPEMIMAEQL